MFLSVTKFLFSAMYRTHRRLHDILHYFSILWFVHIIQDNLKIPTSRLQSIMKDFQNQEPFNGLQDNNYLNNLLILQPLKTDIISKVFMRTWI